MLEYMILPFKRFADFSGRSRRKEYWSFALLNTIVFIVLFTLIFGFGGVSGSLSDVENSGPAALFGIFAGGLGLIVLAYWLAVLIPGIAVTVRRLHDRELSGWWYGGLLIASFIPIVNFFALLGFLVLFVFLLLPGTRGPNRFGPDPKGAGEAQTFA